MDQAPHAYDDGPAAAAKPLGVVPVMLLTPVIHTSGLPIGLMNSVGPGDRGAAGIAFAFLIVFMIGAYPIALMIHAVLTLLFGLIGRLWVNLTLATLVNAAFVCVLLFGPKYGSSEGAEMACTLAVSGQMALSLLAWMQSGPAGFRERRPAWGEAVGRWLRHSPSDPPG